MAGARARFLQNDEEELIRQWTIECLSEIGVKIHSSTVLKILENGGAEIDPDVVNRCEALVKNYEKSVVS